ncbi:MAG: hypothetical protein EHM81_05775 [Chloroflexi bacterium]|nr:MAG: hypothetical protein EHM81_05775 [Chloroflexota bacterium]
MPKSIQRTLLFLMLSLALIAGCSSGTQATKQPPAPPAATSFPPTATEAPPTPSDTPIPSPTFTPTPTSLPPLTGSGGGVIAFTLLSRNNWYIQLMNADGSSQQRLDVGYKSYKGGYEPGWSPDGMKIVYQNNGLWIADIASGEVSPLPAKVTNRYVVKPAWSPDGEWIAFLNEDGFRGDIYLVKPDGSDLKRLTDSADISRDGNLVWSPDGKQLAFSAEREGNIEIYVMGVQEAIKTINGRQRQLTDTKAPTRNLVTSWSADGSRLAFSSDRDGNTEIYLVNPDGSNVLRLTNNAAFDAAPAWSPDGKQIAFISNRDGETEIYAVNVEDALQGAEARRLTDMPGEKAGPTWKPVLSP